MPTYIRVKDLPNAATSPAADDFILLSGAANGARRISRADFLAAVAGFYTSDPSTYKLATLDAGNKVLVSQLPSSAFSYQGTWAASTNTPTLANGTGTGGDTYYASDSGSVDFGAGSISFLAGDAVVYDGSVWQKVPDVVNLLDGKGTLDEAKTTLEIPDVGSNPDEVSLNGMLGSMAFQSAEGISVDRLEVTDKVDGSLGVGATPVTNFHSTASSGSSTNTTIENTHSTDTFANLKSTASSLFIGNKNGSFAVQTSGNGYSDKLIIDSFGGLDIRSVGGATAALFPSAASVNGITALPSATGTPFLVGRDTGSLRSAHFAGNLKFDSGYGIDFGSGASTTLADYEEGTWTPVFGVTSGSFATMTMDVLSARYVKVGNLVNFICYIRTSNVNTTGTGGQLIVSGLPYANAGSNNFAACSVGYAQDWATAPAAGYVVSGGSYIFLTKRVTGINGDLSEMVAGDMTTGAVPNENQLMISGSYSSF